MIKSSLVQIEQSIMRFYIGYRKNDVKRNVVAVS